MDTVNGMALFARVVEANSFRAAADQLGMTPSAVSKQMSRLEDRLGARLLNRTTRRLRLTEVGAVYYEHATHILSEIEDAERAVSQSQAVPRGLLRLSVPLVFGRVKVAPLLPEFLERYPQIRMSVYSHDREVDLVAEGFDLAIRVGHLRDSSMIARKLASNRRAVCATPGYFERWGVPQVPEDLTRHNCLVNQAYTPQHTWAFSTPEGNLQAVPVRGNLAFDNSLAVREAAVRGLGIALLPYYAVDRDLRGGVLKEVLKADVSEDADLYMTYPSVRHMTPKLRVFMDFLLDKFKE